MKQFELDIIKNLNTHLDEQDELQDEAKRFFNEWFETNLDPVAMANDPDGFFDMMSEKAEEAFRKRFLPEILDNAERFGRSLAGEVQGAK